MGKTNTITKAKLLVVEGDQDDLFFGAWISAMNLGDNIQVIQMEGKDNLPTQLTALVKQERFVRGEVLTLVIVRDADLYPDRAFQSVCSALRNAGLNTPRQPYEFIENNNLRIAVLIILSFTQPGALEELVIQTIQDDPILPDVLGLIRQAVIKLPQPSQGLQPRYKHFGPPDHRLGKAHVHAFLATFDEPGRNLGVAARAGVWDFNHPALDPIRAILEEM